MCAYFHESLLGDVQSIASGHKLARIRIIRRICVPFGDLEMLLQRLAWYYLLLVVVLGASVGGGVWWLCLCAWWLVYLQNRLSDCSIARLLDKLTVLAHLQTSPTR